MKHFDDELMDLDDLTPAERIFIAETNKLDAINAEILAADEAERQQRADEEHIRDMESLAEMDRIRWEEDLREEREMHERMGIPYEDPFPPYSADYDPEWDSVWPQAPLDYPVKDNPPTKPKGVPFGEFLLAKAKEMGGL